MRGAAAFVRIRVAQIIVPLRNAVEAEHQQIAAAVLGAVIVDLLRQCADIRWMVIKTADAAHRHLVALRQNFAPHLVQRRTRGTAGILRIQRQHQQPAHALAFQRIDTFGDGGFAIGHGILDTHRFGQQAAQAAGLQVGAQQPFGQVTDTGTGTHQLVEHLGVVAVYGGLQVNGVLFTTALQGEAGDVGVAGQDGLVLRQILRGGGHTVFGQIGGRGN